MERGRAAVRRAFVPFLADERAAVGEFQRADHVTEGRVSCARGGGGIMERSEIYGVNEWRHGHMITTQGDVFVCLPEASA